MQFSAGEELFWYNPGLRRFYFGTSAPRYRRGEPDQWQIFLSSNGNVGEMGHIQVDPLGEHCHCGNCGCLETIATNAAIEQRVSLLLSHGYASKLTPNDCRIDTICQAANCDNGLAVEVIEYVGRQLGKVIALSVNRFNPQKVVLAGKMTKAYEILLPAVQRCIDNQVLKAFRQNLRSSSQPGPQFGHRPVCPGQARYA